MDCEMNIRRITVTSRKGEGYVALTILMLPLLITVMSLAIDGMGLAASYRRAVGLATVGVLAGSADVSFNGGGTALAGGACGAATRAVCENAGGCTGGAGGATSVTVTCTSAGGVIKVTVALKPIRVFGGPRALGAERVVAVARGTPEHGINYGE
jgi:hypothetical protein